MDKKSKSVLVGLSAMLLIGYVFYRALPYLLSLTANLLSLLLILLVVGFLVYSGVQLYRKIG